MLVIIILLMSTGILRFNFLLNDGELSDNDNVNQKEYGISYQVEDYISIDKVDLGSDRVNLEKVSFKNLDSSLVEDFLEDQYELLNGAEYTLNYYKDNNFSTITVDTMVASSNIWYQINKDILTVHYEVVTETELGQARNFLTVNIDLKNNKVITDEDLLLLGNSSFYKIAEDNYNKSLNRLEECSKNNTCYYTYGFAIRDNNIEKNVSYNDFVSNKDKFIKLVEKVVDDNIEVYVKDGVIKYDFYVMSFDLMYLNIGKGGPSGVDTIELGEYK